MGVRCSSSGGAVSTVLMVPPVTIVDGDGNDGNGVMGL